MKHCYYLDVVGVMPDCEHKCESCSFYLEYPPEPEDKEAQDVLPF